MDKIQKEQMITMDEEELIAINGGDAKKNFWQSIIDGITQEINNVFGS